MNILKKILKIILGVIFAILGGFLLAYIVIPQPQPQNVSKAVFYASNDTRATTTINGTVTTQVVGASVSGGAADSISTYDVNVSIRLTSERLSISVNYYNNLSTTVNTRLILNTTSVSSAYEGSTQVLNDKKYVSISNMFNQYIGFNNGNITTTGNTTANLIYAIGRVEDVDGTTSPPTFEEVQYITATHYTNPIDNTNWLYVGFFANEDEASDLIEGSQMCFFLQIPRKNLYYYEEWSSNTYDVGYDVGYGQGYGEGYDVGYGQGEASGYDIGYGEGYDAGMLNYTTAGAFFNSIGDFVVDVFNIAMSLFDQEIIPTSGIAVGHIVIGVPLILGILSLIFKFFGSKKGDE